MFFRKEPKEVKSFELFQFIKNHAKKFRVKNYCIILNVSESGYYKWLKSKDKPNKDEALLAKIKETQNEYLKMKIMGCSEYI